MKSVNELSQAIETLETRNAFQDDIIEQLNHELSVHQGQIAELKQQVALIANRIKENMPEQLGAEEVEPPPPHYYSVFTLIKNRLIQRYYLIVKLVFI